MHSDEIHFLQLFWAKKNVLLKGDAECTVDLRSLSEKWGGADKEL